MVQAAEETDSFLPLNKVIVLTAGAPTPTPPLAVFSGPSEKMNVNRRGKTSGKNPSVPSSRYAERIHPVTHPFIPLHAAFDYL